MQKTETGTQELSRAQRYWREWRGFLLFLAVMFVFRSAVADWNDVPTGSMIPSILEGDRIVVDKLAYDLRVPFTLTRVAKWSDPVRSDVITFESPKDGKLLVKRVVGVPGDTVEMRNNRLIINGEPASYERIEPSALPEPVGVYADRINANYETILGDTRTVMTRRVTHPQTVANFNPIVVPPGKYLVLGDNRDNSHDSRYIGLVPRHSITGRAGSIAFSLDLENYYLPRSDRFFQDLL